MLIRVVSYGRVCLEEKKGGLRWQTGNRRVLGSMNHMMKLYRQGEGAVEKGGLRNETTERMAKGS